ncbi:MAG TPA: alanine:cation symporter family protein [Candidatus Blautia avistercoris]|nr:alanine:cation symporter family protein [Candidatus Blautia avistercoris]
MQAFVDVVTKINGWVWALPLVILCLITGVYFTIRFKGVQFRSIGDMFRLLRNNTSEDGISPFQAFATTVGSRVGMGNISGVATAIFFGGPGAVFWMWILALIGAASAYAETVLAQAYKDREGGEYIGGPQAFISKGLKLKPLAIAFAIAAVLGPGTLMPGLQVYSICSTFENAFGLGQLLVGSICTVLICAVVWGGIKRIGKVAELMAPVMCVIYLIMAIIVMGMHFTELPAVFATIIKSAFGADQMFAGILGATVSWGVKRGVYSNEAGQGSGAIVAAAAECDHPAQQGLVQALSIYIDTILVCSASAMIILLTGNYNVQGADGSLIVENVSTEYGILWAQDGVIQAFGSWGGKLLAIMIVLFVFTSLMGYYYQAESNMKFLFKGKKAGTWLMRIIFMVAVFSGAVVNGEVIWSMADLGVGLMAWFNLIGILWLSNKAAAICKDYDQQRKAGVDPLFDPAKFGIEDPTGAWSKQKALLEQREKGNK